MSRFLLILRGDAATDYSHYTPDDFQQILDEYRTWGERMTAEKRLLGGEKLADDSGRVIHPPKVASQGSPGPIHQEAVHDGPYVESKEVVGGYYLIEADDYAHAVALCEQHPNFRFGSIEIRQIDESAG
ncbi:MAG: YciI family protein [Planctomycetota bacterium]